MNAVLALDPSLSSTGYSIITKTSREIIMCSRYCTKNDTHENVRIKNIVSFLNEIRQNSNVTITDIALEDGYSGISARTSLQLAKLRGGIITYFSLLEIPVYTQAPSEARMNLGLSGNAKKEEVANEVLRLYPHILKTIGPYSDKNNKKKTSDMYDSVGIGIAHLNKIRS